MNLNHEFRDALRSTHPAEDTRKSMVYIRNQVKAPNVHIGEFTYYDSNGRAAANFETDNILYNRPGHGELYIGKFCSIANGVEIIMGAANHSTLSFSTYPFNAISKNWAGRLGMTKEDMPEYKDTVIGNDVWIGREATIMPGVTIGDGAIIASHSVVTKPVPAYHVAAGSPARVKKARFPDEVIAFLEEIKWWDFEPETLESAIPFITSVDIEGAQRGLRELWQADQERKKAKAL